MTGSLNIVFYDRERGREREREREREVLTNKVINSGLERASSHPFTFPLFFHHKLIKIRE